ncbi:twin-arginine translocation pathway signal [Bradyrhizobium sp. LHD-71]|uniref:twin-arginine translocation pathway signal n=1 Tax=Bradyrhizobium sp. LHD-71 TaxID=3072141 RepID=UPI00280F89BE|nr:twin-arginine translocation pathway signal [Bradyrhizobium sp. LHD-71]MDQ8726578.1 twin-arginine translocation pathway signal [Bradyrhizobium sp. LHD-71]
MSLTTKRIARVLVLMASGAMLGGCATTTVDESTFFVDPARYAMYDCQQLAPVRTSAAQRVEELRGLMRKAEGGPAGSIVSEVAYRPDYLSAQGTLKAANAAWERNRCTESQPANPGSASRSPAAPAAGRSRAY